MHFAHGRFSGFGDDGMSFYVFRFDTEFGIVSGEVYAIGHLPNGFDPADEPATAPLVELSTFNVPLNPTREATSVESADGKELILTGPDRVLTFTKTDDPKVLQLSSRAELLQVFTDTAKLTLRSETNFHTLDVQIDRTPGAEPLGSFLLDRRKVTVEECMARAGVRVRIKRTNFPAPTGTSWDDAELDDALRTRFEGFSPNNPARAWRAYMLLAGSYQPDNRVRGYMFDEFGRRGSAVFYSTLSAGLSGDDIQKRYVRTAVHELCHSLNLLHTFDPHNDSFFTTAALSFMNYPEEFPGGASAFWNQFRFEFDPGELRALRHAPVGRLIMGGDHFRGLERLDSPSFDAPARADLKLTLRVRPRRQHPLMFEFGEPVQLEAKLSVVGVKEVEVRDTLEPAYGETVYTVTRPDGREFVFRPLMRRCADAAAVRLQRKTRPAIHAAVFLGYGADGFPFQEPGMYRVSAAISTANGVVRSDPLCLWVRYPDRSTEDLVVPTFDADFGRFLALGGGPHLKRAKQIYKTFLARSGANHSIAVAFRARESIQKCHGFKRLDRRKVVVEAEPMCDRQALAELIGLSENYEPQAAEASVGNILYGRLSGALWRGLEFEGDTAAARKVKRQSHKRLRERGIKPYALRELDRREFPAGGVQDSRPRVN